VVTDKWAGEDEDDVKDNWFDEEKEGSDNEVKAIQVKKKKPLKDRIAEKEAKKKEEIEKKRKEEEEERRKPTAEEMLAEKLRRQQMQEEADLELAKEAFGVDDDSGAKGAIDAFNPTTKEEFEEFGKLICDKVIKYEKSPCYAGFLEILYRDLAVGLESEEVKKLGSALNTLANEKVKAQKAKAKKKSKKANLVVGKGDDYDYDLGAEYDDFI